MKGLIIGLAAGMAAGALLAVNCKECRKMIDKVSNAAEKKMQSMKKQNGSDEMENKSECECGEDCGNHENRGENCNCENGECRENKCECGEDCDCD